jgi:hypothetical protein
MHHIIHRQVILFIGKGSLHNGYFDNLKNRFLDKYIQNKNRKNFMVCFSMIQILYNFIII